MSQAESLPTHCLEVYRKIDSAVHTLSTVPRLASAHWYHPYSRDAQVEKKTSYKRRRGVIRGSPSPSRWSSSHSSGAATDTFPTSASAMDYFNALFKGLEDIKTIHYTHLCSACIIIFDHLITLDAEVDLIWPSPWTLGKVLFLLNRYYSLAAAVFNTYALLLPTKTNIFCLRYFQWQGWTGLIGCMLAEAILQTRLYALYSLNKKILAFMLACFSLSITLSGYIMGSTLSKLTVTAITLPTDGQFCFASNIASNFYMFWIPILAFESLLCGLALYRGLETLRKRQPALHTGGWLVLILIRDSVIYFFAICVTYLTSLLIWVLAPITLIEVPIGFTLAMSCCLANRVLLNVKEASKTIGTLSDSMKPMNARNLGDMSFCSPGTLSQFEMGQLRSMQVMYPLEDILEGSEEEYDLQKVPWVVR